MLTYRVNWWQLVLGGLAWAVFYMFMLQEVFDLSWEKSIIESIGTNLVLFASLLLALNGLQFYHPSTDRMIFLITAASLLSALVVLLDRLFVSFIFDSPEDILYLNKSLFFHGGFALLANAAAIGLSMQWNEIKEQSELQERQEETARLAKEAELLKLRHQLQPHFLFNSLNSINALINSQPQEARKMVQQLSSFLRGTIRADDNQLTPLEKELENINLYLEIEKVRFGHRLQTVVQVDENAKSAQIPPLMLQPLMENAIKFGLYGTTGEVCIELSAGIDGNNLKIKVTNPVDDEVETQIGTGFGLSSIKRRLYLIFGRNDLLQTEKGKTEFMATLKIPQL